MYAKFATTALIVAVTFDSAVGLAKYLDELPNGSIFSQELGHPDNDTSQLTEFATAFSNAGHSWTPEFCGDTFPNASMTNGEAFGDPCCTWKKGDGAADFTVTAFTTIPTQATTCASSNQTETTPTSDSMTPVTTDLPVATDAPPSTASPSAANRGCGVKGAGSKRFRR